jgi:hypothetical protein
MNIAPNLLYQLENSYLNQKAVLINLYKISQIYVNIELLVYKQFFIQIYLSFCV